MRHGAPELKLKLEGLNAFAAMKATMKEMGYDSDDEGDDGYEQDPLDAQLAQGAAAKQPQAQTGAGLAVAVGGGGGHASPPEVAVPMEGSPLHPKKRGAHVSRKQQMSQRVAQLMSLSHFSHLSPHTKYVVCAVACITVLALAGLIVMIAVASSNT